VLIVVRLVGLVAGRRRDDPFQGRRKYIPVGFVFDIPVSHAPEKGHHAAFFESVVICQYTAYAVKAGNAALP
jgi:hypothetical protein